MEKELNSFEKKYPRLQISFHTLDNDIISVIGINKKTNQLELQEFFEDKKELDDYLEK